MKNKNKKPLEVLRDAVGKKANVRLKNGAEYRGKIVQADQYMNIVLSDATEYQDGKKITNYGTMYIKGRSLLFFKIRDSWDL